MPCASQGLGAAALLPPQTEDPGKAGSPAPTLPVHSNQGIG